MPFVFGHGAWCDAWAKRVPAELGAAVVVDVLDDDAVSFFRLVNAGNARAFGDLGMPAWVQLDCATLPTAMVGFAAKKRDLDAALVHDLEKRAGLEGPAFAGQPGYDDVDDDDLVPLSEYCALPTPEDGHVVGFSLYTLVPGLGVRSKALGLLVMGARVQTGVTQIGQLGLERGALKTHARFGPLVVEKRGVQVHSRPGATLVYRLQVPPPATLAALATGAITRVPYVGATTKKPPAALREGDVVVDVEADGVVVAAA